jgi:hypothetical protein
MAVMIELRIAELRIMGVFQHANSGSSPAWRKLLE